MKLKNRFSTVLIVMLMTVSKFVFAQLSANINNVYLFEMGKDRLILTHKQKSPDPNIDMVEDVRTLIIFNKSEFDSIINTALFFSDGRDTSINQVVILFNIVFLENTKLKCSSFQINYKDSKPVIYGENNNEVRLMNTLLEKMDLHIYNEGIYNPKGKHDGWVIIFTPK